MFAGKPGYHIVKRGETLSQIGRIYKQRSIDIVAWNNLANPNDIKVDQVLRVAPPGASDAAVEAQADSVAPSTVEVMPLSSKTALPPLMNKTAPRGEKQPYSDTTLAAMQGREQTTPAAAPTRTDAVKGAEKPPVAPVTASEEDAISWQWPAEGKVIATFSEGKSRGIDIAGKMGQKVNAAAAGRVIYAGAFRGYGNLVIVKHTDNLLSAYAHNKAIVVKQGDNVSKGQQIAEMGNSDSDAVKLHFEIRRQGGKPVDPSKFLPAK
jgi:lipoprotein NlpD